MRFFHTTAILTSNVVIRGGKSYTYFFIFDYDLSVSIIAQMAAKAITITDFRRELPGEIKEDTYRFPVITAKNRASGRNTFWRIYVRVFKVSDNPNYADGKRGSKVTKFAQFKHTYLDNGAIDADLRGWIKVDSGVEGGKTKESSPTFVTVGKNVGRSNETNVVCQALRDALSQYNVQLRKSAPADASDLYPPMLAKKFDENKTKMQYPVFVQRKYNGIRTVAFARDRPRARVAHDAAAAANPDADADANNGDFDVVLYSRSRLEYPGHDYLRDDLRPIFQYTRSIGRNVYLDGELYKHGVPLQKIAGDGRREDVVVADYSYMVYDCFTLGELEMPMKDRLEFVTAIVDGSDCAYAQSVETFTCATIDEIKTKYRQFLDEGFEGLMIRLPDSKYVFSEKGYHSGNLLKLKPRYDDEYELVDWFTAANGKAQGLLMVVCVTEDGRRFNVTPSMEELRRQELAIAFAAEEENNRTHFQNVWEHQRITVFYDEKSTDGIPLRGSTKLNTRVDEPPTA